MLGERGCGVGESLRAGMKARGPVGVEEIVGMWVGVFMKGGFWSRHCVGFVNA